MAIDKRLVFFQGNHVQLKILTEQDIEESGWVGWFNDEAMSEFNQHHYFPNTIAMQREFLNSCLSSEKIQLGIVDRSAPERICGVVSLSAIDFIHRRAEIGAIQQRSYTKANPALALESWSLMIRHGFEQLGLHKIYGGTLNPNMVTTLRRIFNFEVEGVQRRHVFKSSKFQDVTLVAVFSDTVTYPKF